MQIVGRTVLVTGGQRGLGAAIAAEFLAQGAERVYVTARAPRPSSDPRIVPVALDVTDVDSVTNAVQATSDASILVNNAGIDGGFAVLESDVSEMQHIFETNVFGAIRVTQAAAPLLASHDTSAVINVHSVLSWLAGAGAYGASKAALWSFTNSLRTELAPQRTQVIGVHLGLADTEMAASFDAPKISAESVAQAVVAGLQADEHEVLVDDVSRHAKSNLAGPVEHLVMTV